MNIYLETHQQLVKGWWRLWTTYPWQFQEPKDVQTQYILADLLVQSWPYLCVQELCYIFAGFHLIGMLPIRLLGSNFDTA